MVFAPQTIKIQQFLILEYSVMRFNLVLWKPKILKGGFTIVSDGACKVSVLLVKDSKRVPIHGRISLQFALLPVACGFLSFWLEKSRLIQNLDLYWRA